LDSIVSILSNDEDDKGSHNRAGLSSWKNSVQIRKIVLRSGNATWKTVLHARNTDSRDWIKLLDVFVVADANARRADDAVEPTLRAELEKMSLREAVIRFAHEQISSRVKTV